MSEMPRSAGGVRLGVPRAGDLAQAGRELRAITPLLIKCTILSLLAHIVVTALLSIGMFFPEEKKSPAAGAPAAAGTPAVTPAQPTQPGQPSTTPQSSTPQPGPTQGTEGGASKVPAKAGPKEASDIKKVEQRTGEDLSSVKPPPDNPEDIEKAIKDMEGGEEHPKAGAEEAAGEEGKAPEEETPAKKRPQKKPVPSENDDSGKEKKEEGGE